MHPLRLHLENVAAALSLGVMRERINPDVELQMAPPASPAALAALEDGLGRPLPATLREVLGQVSGDARFVWSLRSQETTDQDGFPRDEYLVTPPDAFMEWSQAPDADGNYAPSAHRSPTFTSGGMDFSVAEVLAAAAALPGWLQLYADNPQDDEDTRAHFALIREFMSAGLPIWTAPNGDWLAIDLRDGDEHLLHVSHEGEEAGIELGMTLPEFIAHLSWLGPVWPDWPVIHAFSTRTRDVVAGDPRVTRARFDAAGATGRAWRTWFWAGTDLPDPPAGLLRGAGRG